jgi:zinc D-Ala-D-Ala carboxypeptidase
MKSNLTEHFSLKEMTYLPRLHRCATKEDGLDDVILYNLKRACGVLEQIRAVIGKPIVVINGYRSETYNADVGGAEHSAHLFGKACDFYVRGMTGEQVRQLILPYCKTIKFRVELGTPHVHIDIKPGYGGFWP